MKKTNIIISAVWLLVILTVVSAQQQHTDNNADQVLRGSGRVNASTLGMELQIPLGAYPGRGINVPVTLNYSSKVWRMEYTDTEPLVNNNDGCVSKYTPTYAENSAAGWTTSLATPYIEYTGHDNLYNFEGSAYSGIGCDPVHPTNTPNLAMVRIKRITVHLPGGETHELRDPSGNATGNFPANFDGTFYAADGSNLKFVQNSAGGTYRLLMPDGSFYDFVADQSYLNRATIRKASRFTDRHGNFTLYNDANGTWTDTLGRTLSAPVGLSAPTAPTVKNYALPGTAGSYKFHWKMLKGGSAEESGLTLYDQNLKYPGDKYVSGNRWQTRDAGLCLFRSVYTNYLITVSRVFNPVVLTKIELPNGQSYRFTYDVYGRIERVYYPTGGEEQFVYSVVPQLSHTDADDVNAQTNAGVTNRKVYKSSGQSTFYEWHYGAESVEPNGYAVTITNPDTTKIKRYLHRSALAPARFGYDSALLGMAYREDVYSSANQLVSQQLTNWTVSAVNNAGEWHPRVTSEETRVFDASNNGVSTTATYEYEGDLSQPQTPVLTKKTSQYAFVPVGGLRPQTPVRTSESTYLVNDPEYATVQNAYKIQNMVALITATVVKDGANRIVSKNEVRYDEPAYPLISAGATGNWQDPNSVYRGNATTARVWDSTKGSVANSNAYLQTHAQFDNFGNRRKAWDAKGNVTETDFASPAGEDYRFAFPTKVTTAIPDPYPSQNPDGQAHGSDTPFETTATFDPVTGLPLTTTDANGLQTRIEYDPVTLRPLTTKTFYQNEPVGGMSETVYHDEPNNSWVKTRTQIDVGKWTESISYFDGLGRGFKAEEIGSQGSIYVEKEFDQDGRVKRVTNPFRAGETKHWTTNVYDEASRIKEVILPDGARVKTDYGVLVSDIVGVTKTITDQAGKKRRGITDALGRMTRVTEDPDGQNLNTDYVFDALGNLRKTIQGEQSRYFSYDSLGRLLRAKQPEQDINPNLALPGPDSITGHNQWSIAYEYDDNGNITKTTDAENVSVQGFYDNFNRLKFRDYSDATPDVNFFYDGRGLDSVPAFSKGKTTKVTSSVSETRYLNFDNLGRVLASRQTTGGQVYNFGYQYNLTALIAETYPSGRTVSYEFDRDGDLARVAGQAAPGGRLDNCAKTYANSFSYNSAGTLESVRLGNGKWETAKYNERQQITQIGLGSGTIDASLLKLEYGYGTSQQNNGSLRSQKISFSGLSQSFEQAYTYDDLNRLLQVEEKISNSTAWKQAFAYDRYGNRRFDTGNTTTLPTANNITNPLIDAATNRLAAGQNYLYDKNGSLTQNANGLRFLYDAEHHQREVRDANNQTIARYQYDGEGRRVKKVLISSGEETIFVYNVGGKLAAEYVVNSVSPMPQGSTKYLTADHLGSPRVVTNENGNVISRSDYMAFGEETSTSQRTESLGYQPTNGVRQGYTGYEQDTESGLEFAQARYYNTAYGRFTSNDPLTSSANINNPQTFNRYTYALNSPYVFTDALGLKPDSKMVLDGGCAKRNGRCVPGALSPVDASLFGKQGSEDGATILVPNTLLKQLDTEAAYFSSQGRRAGRMQQSATNQVMAMQNRINRDIPNPIGNAFGLDLGSRMLSMDTTSDGLIIVPEEVEYSATVGTVISGTIRSKLSPSKAVETYNTERKKLNEEYDTKKQAFITLWLNVVVPVQKSSLGFTEANLTEEFLSSFYERKVGSAFRGGIFRGKNSF
ncbi:MAG TPA: RHS repeat-associated core domain-containing protein [Pyrinomonadaceae bacterium]|jgi:RHS repeat-associated protein